MSHIIIKEATLYIYIYIYVYVYIYIYRERERETMLYNVTYLHIYTGKVYGEEGLWSSLIPNFSSPLFNAQNPIGPDGFPA